MLSGECIKAFPQVLVLHRLLVSSTPSPRLPPANPLLNPFDHVLRIRIHTRTRAFFLQSLESTNRRSELHAIVRGVPLTTVELLLVLTGNQKNTPATRTRV